MVVHRRSKCFSLKPFREYFPSEEIRKSMSFDVKILFSKGTLLQTMYNCLMSVQWTTMWQRAIFWPRHFSQSSLLFNCFIIFIIVTEKSFCSLGLLVEWVFNVRKFQPRSATFHVLLRKLFYAADADFVTRQPICNTSLIVFQNPVQNSFPKSAYLWLNLCSLLLQGNYMRNCLGQKGNCLPMRMQHGD